MASINYGKWRARWVDEHGVHRSKNCKDCKEAVYIEKRESARVAEIRRGLRAPSPPVKTFDDLAKDWEDNRAPGKRSGEDDESIIRKHLRPGFGKLRLTELKAAHVEAFLRHPDRAKLSPKTIHNILTLLGSMLKRARDVHEWITRIPHIDKKRLRVPRTVFQYLETQEDIDRFLGAAAKEGIIVHALYATAIYTGMRLGELAGLRWADVHLSGARRYITVQRSFQGPTKAGDIRRIPLVDRLQPVLQNLRDVVGGTLVFTNGVGNMFDGSARIFQDVLHRTLLEAGFRPRERAGKLRPYLTFHGLRHSFASHWMMRGNDIFRLQKYLGHGNVAMTMRYAHLAPEAFTGDYRAFDDEAQSESSTSDDE